MKLTALNGKLATIIRKAYYKLFNPHITIGKNTRIHPSVTLSTDGGTIIIGENCYINKGTIIAAYGGKIVLGNNISVNPYCVLYGHGGLEIGDYTRIATQSVIVPSEHNFEQRDTLIVNQGCSKKGIKIGKDVWVASGVKILDGTKIADGCVLGANAVVKGETEAYGVYVGTPARKVKERS